MASSKKEISTTYEELTSTGEGSGIESEIDSNDDESTRPPFDPAQIDIITQARTIDLLMSRLKHGELDLSPDFQRRGNLWDDGRKTALIESILLRIPIPSLYMSEDQDGVYSVVDGLQRMCAIAHFIDVDSLNKAVRIKKPLKPLELQEKSLRSFKDLKGKTYQELPRPLQRRLTETELTLHIIRSGTPPTVKFNIFSRINQGGLPLKAQEIRNAIYPGNWRNKISEIVEGNAFKEATQNKIRAERMEDIELILRAIAISENKTNRPSDQNLEDYLNDFVEKICPHWDDKKWQVIQKKINAALLNTTLVFGEYSFRKFYHPDEKAKPINKGLFEAQVGVLARYTEKETQKIIANKAIVLKEFIKISDFDFYINNYNSESSLPLDKLEKKMAKEFLESITMATSKGLAFNKRIDIMTHIFDKALK